MFKAMLGNEVSHRSYSKNKRSINHCQPLSKIEFHATNSLFSFFLLLLSKYEVYNTEKM